MTVTTRFSGRACCIDLHGELDLHTVTRFREAVSAAMMARPDINRLIVVLNNTSFIDSSGLGALLAQYRALTTRGGKLMLVGPSPAIQRVLQFSGLLKLIDVVDTEAMALLRA